MGLTALEWLLLPEEEQKRRGHELSPHECFLLRTTYSYVKFTEEEKANMSPEERERILHPKKTLLTEEEKTDILCSIFKEGTNSLSKEAQKS